MENVVSPPTEYVTQVQVDTLNLENLLIEQNKLISQDVVISLFSLGTISAVFVLFLLYKFIKLFY